MFPHGVGTVNASQSDTSGEPNHAGGRPGKAKRPRLHHNQSTIAASMKQPSAKPKATKVSSVNVNPLGKGPNTFAALMVERAAATNASVIKSPKDASTACNIPTHGKTLCALASVDAPTWFPNASRVRTETKTPRAETKEETKTQKKEGKNDATNAD